MVVADLAAQGIHAMSNELESKPLEIPAWLAVPELSGLPVVDQHRIARMALHIASAKHPSGFNFPALAFGCGGAGIAAGVMSMEGAVGRWPFLLLIGVIVVIWIPISLLFGWWWWRVAFSREFKKHMRLGISNHAKI